MAQHVDLSLRVATRIDWVQRENDGKIQQISLRRKVALAISTAGRNLSVLNLGGLSVVNGYFVVDTTLVGTLHHN